MTRKRTDPANMSMFDPIKGAIWYKKNGDYEEACWMVFLATHFGKHPEGGWRYARQVYNRHGQHGIWDWNSVSSNCTAFRNWLDANYNRIRNSQKPGGFGNHRKYQSLKAFSDRGTGMVIETYVNWVLYSGSHKNKFNDVVKSAADEYAAFDSLYQSMDCVMGFGRLGKFDYLTMIGKVGLANIAPGSTYLDGATGPLRGARLLLEDGEEDLSLKEIDQILIKLGNHLGVGMQVIEDALCNWNKSPMKYVDFTG